MFEVETEKLINIIKSKTIGFEKKIKLNQIIETGIPKSIKNYFYLESEALLYRENYFRIDRERFDVTSPEVKRAVLNFDEILKLNCVFLRNEFILLLEKSVSLELNFLSKPRWTLIKFIYKDANSKSIDEIAALMRYFVDYSYYNDILLGYLAKKDIQRVTISDFDKLIKKIDASLIKRYSPRETALMAKPLLDFLNYSNNVKSKNIDIDPLILFYEDKELFGVTSALHLEKEIRGKNSISLEDLALMIERLDDLRKSAPDKEKDFEKSETGKKEENINTILDKKFVPKPQLLEEVDYLSKEENAEVASNIPEESAGVTIPLIGEIDLMPESKFDSQISQSDQYTDHIEEATKIHDAKRVNEIIDDFDYEFTVISGTPHSANSSKVQFFIQEDDEKLFIKKLFNKNEANYRTTIMELSGCKDWKEAASYIDNLFIRYDINPYSNTAINFTDKIQIGFLKHNVH